MCIKLKCGIALCAENYANVSDLLTWDSELKVENPTCEYGYL